MPKKKEVEHKFNFKSKKGQDMEVSYKPKEVEVSDKKAFQTYIEKIVDVLQCSDWGVPKKKEEKTPEPEQPKIKGIDEV